MKRLLWLIPFAALCGGTFAADSARPNILFAIADDWGLHAGYEKFIRGEKVNAGWVSPADFEKQPIKP